MSWERMVGTQEVQIRNDHGRAESIHEDAAWDQATISYGVSFKQGYRSAWWDAILWLLNQQNEWANLTESESVTELRKGAGSIYYPLFHDDPRVWVECPNDGRVTVTAEGMCDHCGWTV